LYNLRALHYIKRNLGFGSIVIEEKRGMGYFWIRDRKVFKNLLFPIFDKYPSLTTKHFYYQRVRLVCSILEDITLTQSDKDCRIFDCLKQEPEHNYISPAWGSIKLPLTDTTEVRKVVSKG